MTHDAQSGLDGVLVVDKPQGITSHDVVARVRRILGTRRIGHVGTLDPLATGVLPLVVGRATRLASLLSTGDKVYQAVFRLGMVTDTYDVTGSAVPGLARQVASDSFSLAVVRAVSQRFVGTYPQTPPPFSAKKIGGVRAYRLARLQRPVTPQAVEVTVRALDVEALDDDQLRCRVTCAPGFYMRALAHDLGQALGSGGCLECLRRERSGSFTLDDATTLDRLEREREAAPERIRPMATLLPELPSVVATEHGSRLVSHGNTLTPKDFVHSQGGDDRGHISPKPPSATRIDVKVYDRNGTLLAIAEGGPAGILRPRIVLV